MQKFSHLYNPITATPFRNDSNYIEIMPCEGLKPYIKCFWGTKKPVTKTKNNIVAEELVIQDTCMDIIFDVNYTENTIYSSFIGINNEPFRTATPNAKEETTSIFAIRFYAWTAALFSEDSMAGVKNNVFEVQQHYSKIKSAIEPLLYDISTLNERVKIAEKVLLTKLNRKRVNHNLENALFCILNNKGNIKTTTLADEVYISSRQLERIFNEYIGVSPKQLSSLVRYQYLWNDILFNQHFNVSDAVYRYGYADQSHLLHDFKRYHTVSPSEAKQHALSVKDIV
ncbi:helix-turn-helix domain-containing protein [Anaerosporobacter sp.]|uniref:helix-turn-helix domain-containing protein n=1 Tax=Anaerosporobacter sp. TaxID=1872529 RepID=UPI00286F9741|nr:helix-turn-helix domain-containing protein [Anaerosporobacter sp.]